MTDTGGADTGGTAAGADALDALRDECEALARIAGALGAAEWARPTRCDPWSVLELVAHIEVAVGRLPRMLEAPAPDVPEVTATQYYRPDARFSAEGNAARVELARSAAAGRTDGADSAARFAATWREVCRLCRAEPPDRLVRTRHGDAMLLSEFVLTRVVEVAVHGLDVADALDYEPWLTPRAEAAVLGLMLGPAYRDVLRAFDWNGPAALRRLTGRAALTAAETERIERLGVTWITLG